MDLAGGAAAGARLGFQLVTGSHRTTDVLYRAPHGTDWQAIPLERAMDMVADRVKKTRDENWEDRGEKEEPLESGAGAHRSQRGCDAPSEAESTDEIDFGSAGDGWIAAAAFCGSSRGVRFGAGSTSVI